MKTDKKYSRVVLIAFVLIFIWWISIQLRGLQDVNENYFYGIALGLLPVLGSIIGFINSKNWGGLKSAMGKSIFFLSGGLLTWGIGTLIFAYYNLVQAVAVPYPSLADVSYIVSWPLWCMGIFYLSKATGAKFGLRSRFGKYILFLIPIIAIVISYYLLVVVARGGVLSSFDGYLKLFFDLAYPIGDVLILTIAVLVFGLSYSYFGGKYKIGIYMVLFGFIVNYFADFFFSYTTSLERYYVANWVDLIFTVAMFALSFGISKLDPKILEHSN